MNKNILFSGKYYTLRSDGKEFLSSRLKGELPYDIDNILLIYGQQADISLVKLLGEPVPFEDSINYCEVPDSKVDEVIGMLERIEGKYKDIER